MEHEDGYPRICQTLEAGEALPIRRAQLLLMNTNDESRRIMVGGLKRFRPVSVNSKSAATAK
jgi:hypothetical protein